MDIQRRITIYHLGGITFTSKKDVKTYAAAILHHHPVGYQLSGPETVFFRDLLEMHPKRDEKIGPGIVAITITTENEFRTPMFIATRLDGSRMDFSYNECLAPTSPLLKFTSACREAVSADTLAFRERTFGDDETVICPLTGQEISRHESHVDHRPPHYFSTIVAMFVDSCQIDVNTVEMDAAYPTRDVFRDKQLREMFRQFHNRLACLRVICAAENMRLSNKGG